MSVDNSDTQVASTSRRTVLKAGGIAAVALASGGVGITGAQSEVEGIEITASPEEEYVTLRNTSESEVDLTGYSINFDAEDQDYNQVRELAGEVVIGAGEEVTVATGAQTSIETDVSLTEPYDGHVLNDDGSDVVALLNPDGDEVARSGESPGGDDNGNDEDDQEGAEEPDEIPEDDSEEPTEDEDEDEDDSESEDESEDAGAQAADESDEDDDCPKD